MSIKKIACCTDFSENAEVAFRSALEMAEKFDAALHVLHVLPQPVNPMISDFEIPLIGDTLPQASLEVQKTLVLKMEEKMEETFGKRMNHLSERKLSILDGHVSTEIITYLEENDIDLVVLGSYGFSGMGLVIFGSVAKRVAHKAHCSVMIAREKVTD
ncbi:MAG: universal stress protein [Proteobacteria bacterium]|nr:universal stress protein [Pseudomonadota bacterium]